MPAATDPAASTAKATVIDAVRLLPDELLNNWWLNLGGVEANSPPCTLSVRSRTYGAASAQKCALLARYKGNVKIRIKTYVSGIASSNKSGGGQCAQAPHCVQKITRCDVNQINRLQMLDVRKYPNIEMTPSHPLISPFDESE